MLKSKVTAIYPTKKLILYFPAFAEQQTFSLVRPVSPQFAGQLTGNDAQFWRCNWKPIQEQKQIGWEWESQKEDKLIKFIIFINIEIQRF